MTSRRETQMGDQVIFISYPLKFDLVYNVGHHKSASNLHGSPDRLWLYYDATTMLLRQRHDIIVGQSYCICSESGWIWMSRGWIVMTDDTPINPELPRMRTNTTTMPLGTIPIPPR